MPTLLQINVASNYGSTGKIAEQIGLLSEKEGWTCYIAHGARFHNPSQLKTFQIDSFWGECVHKGFHSLLLDKDGLGSKKATKKLVKYIKEIVRPDIIHIHNIHGYYINYKVLFDYLLETDVPIVWTLHDCWPFTGHCTHFELKGCTKWQTGCNSCPQKRETPPSLWLDSSQSNYQLKQRLFTALGDRLTLIPVSDWLAHLLKLSFFKNSKINTIHNGIDINTFVPSSSDNIIKQYNLKGKFVLLGVALPWTARKGLYDFIELRKILPEQYAIILLGLSKKQQSKLPSGIIGLERTQNVQEMVELYSAADILVNPTYEDNYPTINLEAMACGTPVITYKTGGSPEAVIDGTGVIVDQGSVTQVVEAIHMLENQDQDTLRKQCRNHAVSCFDKKKCFQTYLDLYQQILNQSNSKD